MSPEDKEVLITLRYDARCSNCDSLLVAGQRAFWNPLTKAVRHQSPDSCAIVNDAVAQDNFDFSDGFGENFND